jgi:hypothetical protein
MRALATAFIPPPWHDQRMHGTTCRDVALVCVCVCSMHLGLDLILCESGTQSQAHWQKAATGTNSELPGGRQMWHEVIRTTSLHI